MLRVWYVVDIRGAKLELRRLELDVTGVSPLVRSGAVWCGLVCVWCASGVRSVNSALHASTSSVSIPGQGRPLPQGCTRCARPRGSSAMDKGRFAEIDRWLTQTLRYGRASVLTVDELHLRAATRHFGRRELLWVATTARKRLRHADFIYRFEIERTATGILVSLNDESEDAHLNKRRRTDEPGRTHPWSN